MKTAQHILRLLAIGTAAWVVAACDQSQPPTVGERVDAGIERTQQAADQARRDAQTAGNEIRQGASQAGAAFTKGAADVTITAQVKAALAGDDQLSALAIEVDTTNRVVTLTGPAPTQSAFERASSLAQAVDGVTEVRNQLTVASKS